MVSPRLEGALAPKVEPLREIPGLRRKEKERTWKDEVRERVRDRRRHRGTVKDEDEPAPAVAPPPSRSVPTPDPPVAAKPEPEPAPESPRAPEPARQAPRLEIAGLEAEEPAAALPLRPLDLRTHVETAAPVEVSHEDEVNEIDEPQPRRFDILDMPSEPTPRPQEPAALAGAPVERPARFGERLQAGALDLALLLGLWGVVVYFAGRAAHVPVAGLRPAWPYLAAYLAFLGLFYAVYFTGTTGQTVGKLARGLRVVDVGGRPPGYLRALVRAALAVPGIVLAGAALVPMFFDPARRAFHDRLLKTRVVKG
jgi:uncharacterized RDD family membrane protein YckC